MVEATNSPWIQFTVQGISGSDSEAKLIKAEASSLLTLVGTCCWFGAPDTLV
jgi:hypothetical protein